MLALPKAYTKLVFSPFPIFIAFCFDPELAMFRVNVMTVLPPDCVHVAPATASPFVGVSCLILQYLCTDKELVPLHITTSAFVMPLSPTPTAIHPFSFKVAVKVIFDLSLDNSISADSFWVNVTVPVVPDWDALLKGRRSTSKHIKTTVVTSIKRNKCACMLRR